MQLMSNCIDNATEFAVNNKLSVLACAVSGTALTFALWWRALTRDLPPGPRFLMFRKFFRPREEIELEQGCLMLRNQYGELVSGQLLSKTFVFLNTYDVIKEAYLEMGDNVAGRAHFKFGNRFDDEDAPGVASADGPVWQEHRRFVLSSLRDFGFGKRTTEAMILEELRHLCQFVEEQGDNGKKSVDMNLAFSKASTNVICSLVFGQRCGTEKEFDEIMAMLRQNRESRFPIFVLLFIRFLMMLPGDPFKFKRAFNNVDKMFEYSDSKIKSHREKHSEGNDSDFIDAYLTTQAQRDRESGGKHSFNDKQLSRVVFELFLAGTDTTATMLRWFFYQIALHPDIQHKVQLEIDEVLGQRTPSLADRSKLKYTDAVVHELQRYVVMLPLGGPLHRAVNEVYVRGYRLPKDSFVLANLYAVFRDPKLWPHPDELNPGNFYDEQNNSLRNTEYLIPFMIGRRACPGESLAKQELFLFFVGLVQRFKFSLDNSFEVEKVPLNGFFRMPPQYRLIAESRF